MIRCFWLDRADEKPTTWAVWIALPGGEYTKQRWEWETERDARREAEKVRACGLMAKVKQN